MFLFPKLKSNKLFDSHAHISSIDFDKDINGVINRAKSNEIEYIFDISVNLDYSHKSIELSKTFPGMVFSFIGIDPEVFILGSPFFVGLNKDEKWFENKYGELSRIIDQNSEFIAGIGESGMDFYHNRTQVGENKEISNKLQERLFKLHLELAHKFKLPLSIHSRFAEKDCLEIVSEYDVKGIFHSYTGTLEIAKQILDAGWGLGVNGIVTFKNATQLREVYKSILGKIPQDVTPEYFYKKGIYFETDAPFLSPEGRRGERNEPANVCIIFDNFCKMLK